MKQGFTKYTKQKDARPDSERLVTRSVAITQAQQDFLNKHDQNLSAITRDAVEAVMRKMRGGK